MDILRYVDVPLLAFGALTGLLVLAGAVGPALRRGDLCAALVIGGRVLLSGALVGVLAVTLLFGRAGGHGVNLVPGVGIRQELANINRGLAVINLAGNVALFVPLGALAGPVLRWRPVTVIAVGALVSAGIEVAQLLTGRNADIDDVLLNTTGTALGVLLAWTASQGRGRRAGRSPLPMPSDPRP